MRPSPGPDPVCRDKWACFICGEKRNDETLSRSRESHCFLYLLCLSPSVDVTSHSQSLQTRSDLLFFILSLALFSSLHCSPFAWLDWALMHIPRLATSMPMCNSELYSKGASPFKHSSSRCKIHKSSFSKAV